MINGNIIIPITNYAISDIVVMPADIFLISRDFNVTFQSLESMSFNTIDKGLFGVLHTSSTTSMTNHDRFPREGVACDADKHQEQEELLEEGWVCLLAGGHVLCGVVFFLERGRKLIAAQVVDIGC